MEIGGETSIQYSDNTLTIDIPSVSGEVYVKDNRNNGVNVKPQNPIGYNESEGIEKLDTTGLNEFDVKAINILHYTGTWDQMLEYLLPKMTNKGIDIIIEIYNQKHPGSLKIASDYYN